MARAKGLLWSVGLGIALYAIFPSAFVNWDTAYALLWGSEVADGRRPDFDGVALAPTTHPLADLVGLVLAPFGDSAAGIVVALGFLALGAVGYLVYRLAATWFGPLAGVAAAAVVLTREPMLSFGARAYVDVPYVALVLGAIAAEVRRPQAGAPVLALLLLAGLLRPEGWLFSAAYLVWLALPGGDRGGAAGEGEDARRRALRLLPLALAAPVLWALVDLASTGDALASLTGTRDNVETLGRATGLDGLVHAGPRRLGEIMRVPALLAAAAGACLGLVWLRRSTLPAVGLAALAFLAFAALALGGLPVVTRYLLLEAALLCVLCGAAVGGWLLVRGSGRAVWVAAAVVVVALFAVFAPSQVERLRDTRAAISEQGRIQDDLHDLVDAGAFRGCEPVVVPTSRPVPLLALWLDRPPGAIQTAGVSETKYAPLPRLVLLPANRRIAKAFALDPRDPGAAPLARPRGFHLRARNRSWRVYANCG